MGDSAKRLGGIFWLRFGSAEAWETAYSRTARGQLIRPDMPVSLGISRHPGVRRIGKDIAAHIASNDSFHVISKVDKRHTDVVLFNHCICAGVAFWTKCCSSIIHDRFACA